MLATRPTTRPRRECGASARRARRARERRARMRALCLARRLEERFLRGAGAALARGAPAAAGRGLHGALDDTELGDEGGARAVAGVRVAGDDAEADLAVLRLQDVRAVAGRVHPGDHDRARGGEVAGAPGEVLADPPGAAARQVAGGADALRGLGAVAAVVGEVGVGDHVAAVAEGGALELAVDLQRLEAAVAALGVEQAQRGVGDRRQVARVGLHVGVGALVGGADALVRVRRGPQHRRVDAARLGQLALALGRGVRDRAAEAAVGDADAHRPRGG